MYDDYGANGFIPVTLNLQENIETVKAYARQYTYEFLRDNGGVWGVYRQNGYIPTNYIVDAEGTIRYIAEGFSESAMRAVIQQYLPGPIEHDVGVKALLVPTGTVDSGDVLVPACSVYNYGPNPETYPVRMRIGTQYSETATVTDHAPGTARYIEFPQWTALERGQLTPRCSTELTGDAIQSNNGRTGLVTVNVHDMAVTVIIVPGATVDSAETVTPEVEVRNFGTVGDMVWARLFIGDFYEDSARVPLHPGRTDTIALSEWVASTVGQFAVRCTVWSRWEMVPGNNILTGTVRVLSSGIEERPDGGIAARCMPTVVRGVLPMPIPEAGQTARSVLLDVSGREVMNLVPGTNDVRHLSPGVYYIRSGRADEVRKVIVQQ